jgi:hypothetical protein
MAGVQVGDIVEIVNVRGDQQHLLHKVGRIMMIVDGRKCLLSFDDGTGATVTVDQLKSVRR